MKKVIESKVDVIDLILQKQAEEFEGQMPSKNSKEINASNFFIVGDSGGFISKPGFLNLVKRQSKTELIEFDAFLKELNSEARISAKPLEKVDKDGRNYVWVTVNYKKGDRQYKVLTAENMSALIGVYQEDIVTCNLSLRDLYEAALS